MTSYFENEGGDMKRIHAYNLAAVTIMAIGIILFFLTPLFISRFNFDTDIIGLNIFIVGLIMWIVGLVKRKN